YGGEAFEPPVFAVFPDDFIEGDNVFGGAFKKLVGKLACLVCGLSALPEFGREFRGLLLAHVPLKEHLHGKCARFAAEGHVTYAAGVRMKGPVLFRKREAFAKVAPFRRPPGLLQNLCSRPLARRDQWPAPGCRRSARRR